MTLAEGLRAHWAWFASRETRGRLFSAEPGAHERVGEAHAVAEVGRLLGLPREPVRDGDRHLDRAQVLLRRLDDELRVVELVLAELEAAQARRAHRPVAARRVGDLAPGEEREQAGEELDPDLAGGVRRVGVAQHARAADDVDLALGDRTDEPGQLGGLVLAVGVHRHDDLGAGREREPVAGAERGALAAVQREPHRRGARGARALGGVVGRAVVDDDRVQLVAAHRRREGAEHVDDVLGPRCTPG